MINSENNLNRIIYKDREFCRLCNSCNLFTWINLEPTPLANKFVKNIISQIVTGAFFIIAFELFLFSLFFSKEKANYTKKRY